MAVRVRRSSGNVFRDLGLAPSEAEHLKARSTLKITAERLIASRGWTQAAAAKAMGVTQPRISDLVRGNIDKFSVDGLIEMPGRAGVEVGVRTRERKREA